MRFLFFLCLTSMMFVQIRGQYEHATTETCDDGYYYDELTNYCYDKPFDLTWVNNISVPQNSFKVDRDEPWSTRFLEAGTRRMSGELLEWSLDRDKGLNKVPLHLFRYGNFDKTEEIMKAAGANVHFIDLTRRIYDYITYFNINVWGSSADKLSNNYMRMPLLLETSAALTEILSSECSDGMIWDKRIQQCRILHCPPGYTMMVFPTDVLNQEILYRSVIFGNEFGNDPKMAWLYDIRTGSGVANSLYKIERMNRHYGFQIKDNKCHPCRTGYMCPNVYTSKKCNSISYQDEEGQTSCKQCPGYYDSTYFLGEKCGPPAWLECARGSRMRITNGGRVGELCVWCPKGKSSTTSSNVIYDRANYVDDDGNRALPENTCETCPAGRFSPDVSDIIGDDDIFPETIRGTIQRKYANVMNTRIPYFYEDYNGGVNRVMYRNKWNYTPQQYLKMNANEIYSAAIKCFQRIKPDEIPLNDLFIEESTGLGVCDVIGCSRKFRGKDTMTKTEFAAWVEYMSNPGFRVHRDLVYSRNIVLLYILGAVKSLDLYKGSFYWNKKNIIDMNKISDAQGILKQISPYDKRHLHLHASNVMVSSKIRDSLSNIKMACIECRPGMYTESQGQSSCKYCPGGWHSANFSSTKCSTCGQAKFSEEGSFCKSCDYDQVGKFESNTHCEYCEPGKFTKDNINCISCPRGYYKSIYEGMCEACRPGFHNPDENSKYIQDCKINPYILDARGVSGWGYGSYGLCPTGKYTSTGDVNKCEWCSGNRYTFPYGTVTHVGDLPIIRPPKTLKCLTCPAGRGIQYSTKNPYQRISTGEKRNFGEILNVFENLDTTRFSNYQAHAKTPIGRYCQTCPPGKQNLGKSAFCTDCPKNSATELGYMHYVYKPSEPCSGATGMGFLNDPLTTYPKKFTSVVKLGGCLDWTTRSCAAINEYKRTLKYIPIEKYKRQGLTGTPVIDVHPSARDVTKKCFTQKAYERGGMIWGNSGEVECSDKTVMYVALETTFIPERTFTMCEKGYVPDVSEQFCVPCRPATKLGTYKAYGGWYDGLCYSDRCPGQTTSTGFLVSRNSSKQNMYFECESCDYEVNYYGYCEKPTPPAPSGYIRSPKYFGDPLPSLYKECNPNQYRDGATDLENGIRGTGNMPCIDCRTKQGYYAFKIDIYPEARQCKKVPSNEYLVNQDGNGVVGRETCQANHISGQQCLGAPIEICPAGQYYFDNECGDPPPGKVTKEGAYGTTNIFDECPAGTYTTNSACIECPYWQYQRAVDQTSCIDCPGGTEYGPGSGKGKTVCDICPGGTFSWNNAAQEVTIEQLNSLWPTIQSQVEQEHSNYVFVSSLQGYEYLIHNSPKVYIGKVMGSVWSPVPLNPAANYANLDEVRAHCDQNIYCSGVIIQRGIQALCFSTDYITHAMKQEYPDMGNNAQSDYTHTFVAVRLPRFELKAANLEAIHSVQAQRTSIHPKVETILEQLNTCYSCSQSHYISQSYRIDSMHTLSESGNYNEHILNKTEGYPFKDDNNNAVCIANQQRHEQWVFSIENPKCPKGLWVPTTQVTLSDTYVYESDGRSITQQTETVPEHCEVDKEQRNCAAGTMEMHPAVIDDYDRMTRQPECWEPMDVIRDYILVFEDRITQGEIPLEVYENVHCNIYPEPNVTDVGTIHEEDIYTDYAADIDVLHSRKILVEDDNQQTVTTLSEGHYDVTATCNLRKFYREGYVSKSAYDDKICPVAVYKCDNEVTNQTKQECEDTENIWQEFYYRSAEITRTRWNWRTKQFDSYNYTYNEYVPSKCLDSANHTTTGNTKESCEKTGKTFTIECEDSTRRLWQVKEQKLEMVSTNLFEPKKCHLNGKDIYYVSEEDCASENGTFTDFQCTNNGNSVSVSSPEECILTTEFEHVCDTYKNRNSPTRTPATQSAMQFGSIMDDFCRQFSEQPWTSWCERETTSYRTGTKVTQAYWKHVFDSLQDCTRYRSDSVYVPYDEAVMIERHEDSSVFGLDVLPQDDDDDDVHDSEDICSDTPTSGNSFGNWISLEGCSYEQDSSDAYKEFLYEQFCTNTDVARHNDCSLLEMSTLPPVAMRSDMLQIIDSNQQNIRFAEYD